MDALFLTPVPQGKGYARSHMPLVAYQATTCIIAHERIGAPNSGNRLWR